MARPLGSGPIHVYLGFGPANEILAGNPPVHVNGAPAPVDAFGAGTLGAIYYGTTRSGPDITEELSYYPVMNDLTGPVQSLDDGYAGREDTIALVMSSWSQVVDNYLEQFLRTPVGAQVIGLRGTDALSDLGTLMVSEGKTIGMWLVKAAASKAVNVMSGMPVGRYYFCTTMVGPNKIIDGNKECLRVRIFRAKKDLTEINSGFLPLFSEDPVYFSTSMLNGSAAVFG